MNLQDQLYIIKNKIFEKRNIILMIILTIIFLIFFTCLTVIEFSIENKKEITTSESTRKYYVNITEDQIEDVSNIEHIAVLKSYKYNNGTSFKVDEFSKDNEEGIIYIKPLLINSSIEIISGKTIENNNELVCSNTFYPHEYEDKISKKLFLSSKDILNKTISITSHNEELNNEKINLTIVGTYKNKYLEEANTCYVNINTYDTLASKYNGAYETYDDYGNVTGTEYAEYTDYFIIIDSNDNINQVLSSLKQMNITYDQMSYINSSTLDLIYAIPLFIGIIVIILTIFILNNFIKKKNINRIHNIGILKSTGYTNENILKLNINENIIIILISCLLSLIIYLIALNNLKYTLLAEITYSNYILNIPYILIIITILLLILLVIIIVKSNFKKIFKLDIKELLEK